MSSNFNVSRRTLLRGLGVSLALPWMDAMSGAKAFGAATGTTSGPPRRMAFMFVPNGVHLPDWTPKAAGYGYDLPYILEPLSNVRDDLMVVSGLTHDKGPRQR